MAETIDTTDRPHRACRFVCDLHADDRQRIVDELRDLANDLEAGQLRHGVMGGYGAGMIYEYIEGGTPHDQYFKDLEAYLARREAAAGVTVAHGHTFPPSDADGKAHADQA